MDATEQVPINSTSQPLAGQVAVQDELSSNAQVPINQAPTNYLPSVDENFGSQVVPAVYPDTSPLINAQIENNEIKSIDQPYSNVVNTTDYPPVTSMQSGPVEVQAVNPMVNVTELAVSSELAQSQNYQGVENVLIVENSPVQSNNIDSVSPAWNQIAQVNTEVPLELGAIGSKESSDLTQKQEAVPGLMLGGNIDVVKQLSQVKTELPVEGQKVDYPKHPLTDLYANLEQMSKNSQLVLDQEMDASRHNRTLEQVRDDALGWQITSKITNVLMVFSWVLAIVSLFFPLIFNNVVSEKGLTVDFGLFIVTITVLLTCTILSFWVHSHKILKSITWCVFVFFIFIFVLISLKSGGVIGANIPVMNVFLNRFSL